MNNREAYNYLLRAVETTECKNNLLDKFAQLAQTQPTLKDPTKMPQDVSLMILESDYQYKKVRESTQGAQA